MHSINTQHRNITQFPKPNELYITVGTWPPMTETGLPPSTQKNKGWTPVPLNIYLIISEYSIF